MGIQLQNKTKAAPQPSFTPVKTGLLQRACACGQHTIAGEECAECRQKREGMMRRAAVNAGAVHAVPPIVHDVLSSPGEPLDAGTRAFMEPRFGHDFSQVRVHTDAKAAESARAVNALAYTVGRDVVFGKGQYAPGTSEGRRLLAHELTHVVQQEAGIAMSKGIGSRGDSYEREAERVAAAVSMGRFARVKTLTPQHFLQYQQEEGSSLPEPPFGLPQRPPGLLPSGEEPQQRPPASSMPTSSGNRGTATWLNPVINQRNLAELRFRRKFILGTRIGLTTPFINERELKTSMDVLIAIPRPDIENKTTEEMCECWFRHGVAARGRTTMDILTPGPWQITMSKSEAAADAEITERSCETGQGTTTIRVNGRPNDAAIERFVRNGEAEHNDDAHQAFNRNIAQYVANINRFLGDTPTSRVRGQNPIACEMQLRQLENRDLLIQFAVEWNEAKERRDANQRHMLEFSRPLVNSDCSSVICQVKRSVP